MICVQFLPVTLKKELNRNNIVVIVVQCYDHGVR